MKYAASAGLMRPRESASHAGGAARLTVFDGAEHVSVPGLVWRDDDLHLADWLIGAAG